MVISKFTLHHGDCLDVLRTLPDNSVDAVVTDPPYGLNFMGKRWDYDVPSVEVWAECLRALKPGGHLLAFSGTRTYHRMTVRIEDAGFEVRDMIQWVYGSGFPKSHNGKWGGTALKPAQEPICMARKPLDGTVEESWKKWGTGALNIDGCRVEPTGESRPRIGEASQDNRYTEQGGTNFAATPGIRGGDPAGRWPANLIHDGSEEVVALFPESDGQAGAIRGTEPSRTGGPGTNCYGEYSGSRPPAEPRRDSGSAARFFYCPKASKSDRDEGLEGFGKTSGGFISNTSGQHMTRRDEGYQVAPRANNHPTVEPTDLMRYLCRLVTPPGGVVLDPFMGSGSTGKGAILEGFQFIGMEREASYIEIARARIQHVATHGDSYLERPAAKPPVDDQHDLFGDAA